MTVIWKEIIDMSSCKSVKNGLMNLVAKVPYIILVYSILNKCMLYFFPKNIAMRRFVNKISKIDSIKDYDDFKILMQSKKKKNTMISYFKTDLKKYPYGYYNEILNYAGIKKEKFRSFSYLEHGIRFGSDDNWRYSPLCTSFVFQGKYRFEEIRKCNNTVPIYSIGPYIEYARDYYSDEKITIIKKKLGKTLLVMPCHTWELGQVERDGSDLLSIVFNKYASNYDSILVCAYWNDIDAPDYTEYKNRGARVVSAGFREDPNFIRRLKTIINLSDEVVSDDLGTNIGYCLALNKNFYLESSENRYPHEVVYCRYYNRFVEAFYSENKEFTTKQIELQQQLFDELWGGKNNTKSNRELNDIFKEIYIKVRNNRYRFL